MKIFLDTADVDLIGPAYETGLIDGVTTNPTLILKSGRRLKDVLKELLIVFPALDSISAEVVGETYNEMLSQSSDYLDYLTSSGKDPVAAALFGNDKPDWETCISNTVTIKVPCTVEGLKVCRKLSRDRIKTNVTLVFSVAQAILAARAGATYISPFVGRWMDNSVDGIELIRNIREVYDQMGTETKILAASIRDVRQVEQCAKYGADIVTIPPLVFWAMYKNIMTDKGLEQFNKDWQAAQ